MSAERDALVSFIKRDLGENWERYVSEFLTDGEQSELPDMTEDRRKRISRDIENGLEFTRDVLNDPTILDHIPDGSSVKAIPVAERDPAVQYDIETSRYLAIVTPGGMDKPVPETRSNGRTRRIDRNDAARLRRIRAAHR